MEGIKIVAFAFFLWGIHLSTVQCQKCEIERKAYGRIHSNALELSVSTKCWTITVPSGHFIEIKLIKIETSVSCDKGYVNISIPGKSDAYKFCSTDDYKTPITAFGNVNVTHYVPFFKISSILELEYTVKTICTIKNSFKCDNNLCVPEEKVCNGVKDCKNGDDEIGCPGIPDISGIDEARESAIHWMRNRRDQLKSEELPRAVVALFLGSSANFNGTDLEEELMATRVELKTAAALLKSSLTSIELSMFINALLVTCHNPRKFYEHNLVNRLKEQVEKTEDFVHPSAYLTLCNANETWPEKAESYLNQILNSDLESPFLRDLQAVAVMALSCKIGLDEGPGSTTYNFTSYYNIIQKFKESQLPEGSFGNVYTTALIMQALIASGEEHKPDWNLNATIEFLMNEINTSSVDFLTTYYTLPLFNGKTLADISTIDCSANPRKQGYDIENVSRSKIRILYSLYIGDEKDFIHTTSLTVAENSTAFEIMKSAAIDDPKYRFEAKAVVGKMYVHRIGRIANDPDMGKYWLLYVGESNNTQKLTHLTTSPDKIILRNGQHLVYWHKTAISIMNK